MADDGNSLATGGRILIVAFFLVAGLCNLAPERVKDHIERMRALGTPLPALAHWVGVAMQFTGCALLLAGWQAEAGVWLLIVFTVAATAIFHRFWLVQDPFRRNVSRVMLLNNLGILGGLVLVLAHVR
jgi:putative oxidoreductase